ncbi:MAG TPA: hypothetical protein VHM91_15630, partial [Verrucomicrobiales bacterium]|nr:hypothetical protein [Verrucomicrobiales bacterium]
NTATLTINHSGVLDLNNNSESGASLSGSGSILLTGGASFSPAGSGTSVWTGSIVGPGAIRKRGTSSLTLKGTMPSTIGVYIEEGTLSLDLPPGSGPPLLVNVGDGGGAATSAVLRLSSNNQLSASTKVSVLADGYLDLNGTTAAVGQMSITTGVINIGNGKLTTTDILTMSGGSILSGAQGSLALGAPVVATSSFAASASISAPLALEISPSITVNAGSVQPELIISGVIKDGSAGSRGFQKLGTGTLRCSGGTTNTFTGTAIVETGVLELNNSVGSVIPLALQIGNDVDPPGTAIVRNLVQLNLAAAAGVMIKSSGVFQLNNFGDRCDTLRGSGSVALGTARLTVGGSNGSSEFNGVISGTGGLTKNGTGTFTTTGNNPFSGTTQITGGLLLVNGIHGSSAVTVTGGALGGTGAAGPSVTASAGGSVAPGGASPGSLLVNGPVNLSGGGRLAVRLNDVANPKSDQIQTTGNLNITGAVLAPIPSGPLSGNPYVVATYGSLTGTFLTSPPGTTINYAYNDGNSTNHIAITVTNPWLAWLAGYGLDPATTGAPSADPDKDGVPNAVEFVLGTDPTKPINPEDRPALSVSGSDVVFTFRRMASTAYLNPLPRSSTDLNTWANAAGTLSVAPNFYGPGIDRVTLTAPRSGNRRYYRLEVTIP